MKIHIVQKGDSLWKISKKYGVDFQELKKLNSQLSNPDLIMPGMKIKIPSSGVPVKTDHQKAKEMPKPKEHPYVKEKPKDVVQVQDTKPKEKPNEPVPYVPPVPKIEQPVFPQVDVNYYQTNLYQPFTPPPKKEHHEKKDHVHEKKDHVHDKKDHKDHVHYENKEHKDHKDHKDHFHHENKGHLKDEVAKGYDPFIHIPHQKEEGKDMEHSNYPNLPNFPQMPNVGGAAVGGMAENKEHHHHHQHHDAYDPYYGYGHYMPAMYPYPQQMVPASPILPGSGLCYPVQPYYHHHMMPYPYPAQPYYPAYQAPAYYGEHYEHHANDGHHWHHHMHPNANANANVNANVNQGFYPNVSNEAYGKEDCGCDDGMKQHQPWPGHYPNPVPYGQMGAYPAQPYMQPYPGQSVFARPEEDEEE
ncbi:SafA/ExsA family spore coat assembly protein [Bacillus pumilus]|uniref:SpoVID-associated morphogenetic protein n=1 Tax=Bacillus pumilus (strain SAFR-032) TaxID=315750 RepID=A8FFS1_BACP2|nr:SafA/ExsA family spore coat assembly protein [Bacillus pumilus]ABV63088.1 SpoVID-associated morphogenetic protein [Bacillus pumilus SAFR-032]AVI41804.1 LysM peptidoglycan-binding domain-containing protein [Bacillus pumilus]MBC3643351.1 SafA/ExsA family spore coat assembly protein [Bacillus pumilus]MBC3645800.1 SafA/ExsA family spore coat assembly protein [Bacillus pumilus]MBC3649324.1 SafA/ExsA family spore coat assembly protein [Bacillus pumilus]